MKSRTIPGKSRILGVCCLLLFGLFVLYHVQQVEDLRLAGMRCDQHELTMRSKFEVEMEKVERLEKRLEVARVSEEKMQQKLRADRDLRDKAMKDSNMRFSSLQQHYKLLQSEHEDVKVEYANLQQSQAMSKKANLATIEEWKVGLTISHSHTLAHLLTFTSSPNTPPWRASSRTWNRQ